MFTEKINDAETSYQPKLENRKILGRTLGRQEKYAPYIMMCIDSVLSIPTTVQTLHGHI
jgi:hypothetical protein